MGQAVIDYAAMDERTLVARAAAGDHASFRTIMQRCNQRLFRVARAVMGSDADAEDVLQDSYLRAFAGFGEFRGESSLLTWLTAITLNVARERLRRRKHMVALTVMDESRSQVVSLRDAADPEAEAGRREVRRLLELAIDRLPAGFRIVFVLREIEDCGIEETSAQLGISPQTVKTRLHRARRMLRRDLQGQFAIGVGETFPFLGRRCVDIADRVLAKI